MLALTLATLITKQDNFELVRYQIAVIIIENQAAQVVLAAGEPDPNLWKLRVFAERANAWEQFLNAPDAGAAADESPIVNVWYETGTFDQSKSDVVEHQTHLGVFNIDVYGWAQARTDGGTGQIPGDLAASQNAERGMRFVRNFLMAAQNTYLQLRDKGGAPLGPGVGMRFPQSIEKFQVDVGEVAAHQILGMRLSLQVSFSEFSPQEDHTNLLDLVTVDIKRDSDGLLIAETDFQF